MTPDGLLSWVVLAALGAAGALLYKAAGTCWQAFKRQVLVEIVVKDNEPYAWVAEWLARQVAGKRCRKISVHEREKDDGEPADDPLSSRAFFVPGIGSHILWRRGRRILVTREEESTVRRPGDYQMPTPEYFTLRSLGRDPGFLKELVFEAEQQYRECRAHALSVWQVDKWGTWHRSSMEEGRALDTVVLPSGAAENLLRDLRQFLGARERYANVGVPYRRGYLFHGPPGTGKSSLAKALATECLLDLYVLPVGSGMNDDILGSALRGVRGRSMVLLEDVEEAVSQDPDKGVTRSGLLNVLDGVVASQGRILVMTTNHPDQLDSALTRPGRADVHLSLGPADAGQGTSMYERFFPKEDGRAFGELVVGTTPARIQGHLLAHWDNAEEAMNTWRTE